MARSLILLLAILFIAQCTFAFYTSSDPVIKLDESNFDRLVLKSNDVWIVEWYAEYCGHCRNFVPEYTKAAKVLNGIVKVGAIDAQANRSLGDRYGIQGFPTVKIFGADKTKPIEYNGERQAKPIASAALKEIREVVSSRLNGGNKPNTNSNSNSSSSSNKPASGAPGQVISLTGSQFETQVLRNKDNELWFVAFTASYCGHCKNMKPDYEAAAKHFSNNPLVKFANIDCPSGSNQSVCSNQGVQGYPTFKLYFNGNVTPYESGRSKSDFVSFITNKANTLRKIEAIELTTQKDLDVCNESSICVLSIFPDLYDSTPEDRNRYISILKTAVDKNKQYPVQWLYTYARTHKNIENHFPTPLGSNGYPTVVLWNHRKGAYSQLYRSFTEENISKWIGGIYSLSTGLTPLQLPLPPVTTVQPWDGKPAPKQQDEL